MRPAQPLETIIRDVRYGLRSLKSHPLFTLTAILSLTLGIGANTAIFTLMHVILWKPLPVKEPGRIVQLMRTGPSDPDGLSGRYSWYLFRQLGETTQPFGELVARTAASRQKFGLNLDSAERVTGEPVSANYFHALGVSPSGGRVFDPADDSILGGRHVAVLSHAFRATRFRSDSSVLGKTIYYDETPFEVVGIAEPGFSGVQSGASTDVWVPVTAVVPASDLQLKNESFLSVFARLSAATDIRAAQAAWNARFRGYIQRDVSPRYPPQDRWLVESERVAVRPAGAGLAGTLQQYRKPLFLLMGAVVLVLLISCANIANLVLARNAARGLEIEVRLALGASRSRIASQLLIESLLIALGGAISGAALAVAAADAVIALLPSSGTQSVLDPHPDRAVLSFTMATVSAAAILFGLLPALRASHRGLAGSGTRVTAGSFSGRALVAGQLTLSLVLLIGAGLFLVTIRNLKATDLGFRPESVVGFDVSFARGTSADQIRQTYTRIRENLRGSVGVDSVSYVWPSVYSRGARWRRGVTVEGRALHAWPAGLCLWVSVGPEFFETMKIDLVAGRYLDERDQLSATPAIVVNESFASAYLAGASQVGRHVVFDGAPSKTWKIVGIVRDAKHYGVREKVCSTTYVPAGQAPASNAFAAQGFGSFLLRTGADPFPIGAGVRAAVSAAGGGTQIEDIRPLETIVNDMIGQEYMIAVLATAFAILALVLAAIGLYGVMAYSVSRRTSELGIRMALGAAPGDVQRLVLTETAQLVAIGVGVGMAAALFLTRFTSNLLYGVRPTDQLVFCAASVLLAAVAGVAAHLPARRASRLDPMIALRHE